VEQVTIRFASLAILLTQSPVLCHNIPCPTHRHKPYTSQTIGVLPRASWRRTGELQEPSKKAIGRVIEAQDQLVENAKAGGDGEAAD